jgi:hypothetical protein
VRPLGVALAAALVAQADAASADPTKQECVEANETAQGLRQHERLQAARGALAACLATSCPGPVREDCADRLAEIDRAMPTVVFAVTDPRGHDLVQVALRVDGNLVASRLDGVAIPIDPGPHALTFVPASGMVLETTIVVREGEKDRKEPVVLLGKDADEVRVQRIAGFALAGLGAIGVVIGGVLGVVAKSNYDGALQGECGGDAQRCSPAGVAGVNAAHGEAAGATGGFLAGVALLGGGVALWVTAPRGVGVVPVVGGATFAFGGTF